MKFSNLPRARLAYLPTPLQELPRLSEALKGPRIFIKRDDLTGLALGGNKTRKLEYLMGDAVAKKADYIVTGAGFQSNWCTQATAAAKKLGMQTCLVKAGPQEGYDPEEYDGNHLLHFLAGADIKVVTMETMEKVVMQVMEKLRRQGHRPYHLEAAGSTPLGVLGYLNCMLELTSQLVELGLKADYLVHATGTGGTQAGLVMGAKFFNTGIKVIGSTTGSRPQEEAVRNVSSIIRDSLEKLELEASIAAEDINIYDQYAGDGYGFLTEEKIEALKLAAQTECLFLDPVYTGSAMACLIDLCRQGFFTPDEVVIFLHTGGIGGLFPYKVPIKSHLQGQGLDWIIPPWSPAAAK